MMEVAFWALLILFAVPYLGYPGFLLILTRLARPQKAAEEPSGGYAPTVSVLIAARNEEKVISDRIENLIRQEYPGRIEILIGSDASEDDTDRIVSSYADRGVKLFHSDHRLGKPGILKHLVDMSSGEILIFTDADTIFAPSTVAELVRPFEDREVGCVDGSRRNSLSKDSCESTYWKYERWIKQLCSDFGALLGATGAVFAVRKDLYMPLTENRADDFELAVMPRIQGYRCVYNDNALATEPTPDDSRQFRRMVRIVSWMSVSAVLLLLRAVRRGRLLLAAQLVVHKLLRWCSGLFLIAATVVSFFLRNQPFYLAAFVLLMLFHSLAVAGKLLKDRLPSKLLLPYYFWLMNWASTVGLLRLAIGVPIETWDRNPGQGAAQGGEG